MTLATGWRGNFATLAASCLGLVVFSDWLFYDHGRIGISSAIFAAAMLALMSLRGARYLRSNAGRIIFIATLGLILALAEQPMPLTITYTLLCLGFLAMINAGGWQSSVV